MQKIINIMSHSPAYELFWNDPLPEISWNTPDGRWVGVWGKDWAELIGTEVLKLSDEFIYEVWQPDLRADRIYAHTFPNGLVRKLFPAELRKKRYGLKKLRYVVSTSIYDNLKTETRRNTVILHLNEINPGISRDILAVTDSYPIVLQFFGKVILPLNTLFKFKKNMPAKINDLREHFVIKELMRKVTVAIYCNREDREILKTYTKNRVIALPVGVNFDFWKRRSKKEIARKSLGLGNDGFILLSSSRLNHLKQIDKIIKVLNDLGDSFDFQYIITGHGEQKYERYLASVGEKLIRNGKLKFVGFLKEKRLLEYYSAADLFVSTSLVEGGPISAVKAMAMEIPILSTPTGIVGEFLSQHDAGVLVPATGYKVWEQILKEIFCGKRIKTINREVGRSFFHWSNVAKRYVEMYEELFLGSCSKE